MIQLLKKLLLTALIVAQLRATVRASGVEAILDCASTAFATIRRLQWALGHGSLDCGPRRRLGGSDKQSPAGC
ncbi:hypothetical protein [Aquimonas sp.]|uniref:hypothetical protein n=1 Tax=Aquimonas sp. TaxID=1872588 RepID=UPI0037C12A71